MKTRSILLAIVVIGLSVCATNFLPGNQAEAWIIHLTQTGLSFRLKPDLKVMKFVPVQGSCVSSPIYLSGYRNINFEVVIKNIGITTSPYFQMMISDQSWFVAGGAIGMVLAGGETYTGGAGTILLGNTYRYLTLTVYPISIGRVPGSPTNPMDYMSRSLDGNVLNNTAVGRIYLEPCPQ